MKLNKKPNKAKNPKGFTLVELLIVIALVGITAGVTTDIISSLIRSYSKTKIISEIEQNGNVALAKLEKELKSATLVVSVTDAEIVFEREINGETVEVTYSIINGSLFRSEDGGDDIALILNEPGGVRIANTNIFTLVQSDPDVIYTQFIFVQADDTTQNPFIGEVHLNSTVVLRGTYQ